MAKKTKEVAPAAKGKAAKEEPKKGKVAEKSADADKADKAAKREARMQRLKERPAEQRPNSKQVDIIKVGTGSVESFGYAVRKSGTVVTSVLLDAKGNPIGISTVYVPGTKVKVKKLHGAIIPGVAGAGKKGKADDEEEEEEEDED